jgi:hypothetical protein
MEELTRKRQEWNKQQKRLRPLLAKTDQFNAAIQLFLGQHAQLHASEMAPTRQKTYADLILEDIDETGLRRIPRSSVHSIIWLIWHMARIEDVTMNRLIAGSPQLLHQENLLAKMNVAYQDTGNAMNTAEIADLSSKVDVTALFAYRLAVGRRTRTVVQALPAESLKQKVDPGRLQQIMDEGAVSAASRGLLDYWGKRTHAGLLLMPPTRHNMVHLNEALKLKQKRL